MQFVFKVLFWTIVTKFRDFKHSVNS